MKETMSFVADHKKSFMPWALSNGQPRLILLDGKAEAAQELPPAALRKAVFDLANRLRGIAAPGDRVVIAMANELCFLQTVLACLSAGIVAVPAVAPGSTRNHQRLAHYCANAKPRAVLVDAVGARQLKIRSEGAAIAGTQVVELAALPPSPPDTPSTPTELASDALTYLQYTSGSTRAPKGVMIQQAQLAAQLDMLARRFPLRPGEVLLNPMPLYHDFGLVISLHALSCGATAVMLPPLHAIRDPGLWLIAITRFRTRFTASATFLLDLCTRRVSEDVATRLDLSSLEALITGAEPIPAGIVHDFVDRFAHCGFQASALRPAYGLAEATLMLTSADHNGLVTSAFDAEALRQRRVRPLAGGQELVSSGRACFEDSLRIVDPESRRPCCADRAGEVWVRAPCVGAGYWNNPQASSDTMGNSLPGQPGRWLRTGDLGFICNDELYILGRISDTIIVRGENRYPQDIEWSVAGCHPAINAGGVAAIALNDQGLDRLALVCEIRRTARRKLKTDDVFRAVRQAVVEQHGLLAERIILIPEASLPKTSSGKMERSRTLKEYLANELRMLAEWRYDPVTEDAASQADDSLLGLCRRLLQAPGLESTDSLYVHGLDSLRAAELLLAIEDRCGHRLALDELDQGWTVAELERRLAIEPTAAAVATGGAVQDLESDCDPALLARLKSYTGSWRGDWQSPGGLAFGRNVQGYRRPLIWCFQGEAEFAALASALGPDQPLFGLRSAHYIAAMDDATSMRQLAARYHAELVTAPGLQESAAWHLGGNCQGSVIALAIARQRLDAGLPVARLHLLENITARLDPRPVPVPVSMFFGRHSREFNPYMLFPDPEPGWRQLYPLGYQVRLIEADHGQYFSGPGLTELCVHLQASLALPIADGVPSPPADALPISLADAVAELSLAADCPAHLMPGESRVLKVRVHNRSARTWTAQDPLILGNHWLTEDEGVVRWLDGHIELNEGLPPGAATDLKLTVKAPNEPGEYRLELDLAESGIAWFGERGNRPWQRLIRVGFSSGAD